MTTPKVSVILTSYNHAGYLGAAIKSVLEQDFTDFELIIADDASTDDSQHVIRQFNDSRIRFISHSENQGVCRNFNHALQEARGTYIAQLGSDDLFRPEKLSRQVALMDAQPEIGAVFTYVEIIGRNGAPYRWHPLRHFKHFFNQPNRSRHEWLKQLFSNNCLAAPSAMMRKSAIERIGAYDERYAVYQDYDWWIRFCLAGYNLHVIPEALTWYRRLPRGNSLSAKSLAVYNKTRFEHKHLLRQYRLLTCEDFHHVFGNTVTAENSDLLAYHLSCQALAMRTRTHRELALELLYELFSNPQSVRRLEQLHGFGLPHYYRLTEKNALGVPHGLRAWLGQTLIPLVGMRMHDWLCGWIYKKKTISHILRWIA